MEFPVLINNVPKLYENEVLFLEKKNIKFIIDEKSYNGVIYLSNLRLVFASFEYSFDMPLANITDELFNQPLFSPNNLSGNVKMIENEEITKKWKIQFYDSVNTFLNMFTLSLYKMRKYLEKPDEKRPNDQTPVSAFIDPNDSSILYVSFI